MKARPKSSDRRRRRTPLNRCRLSRTSDSLPSSSTVNIPGEINDIHRRSRRCPMEVRTAAATALTIARYKKWRIRIPSSETGSSNFRDAPCERSRSQTLFGLIVRTSNTVSARKEETRHRLRSDGSPPAGSMRDMSASLGMTTTNRESQSPRSVPSATGKRGKGFRSSIKESRSVFARIATTSNGGGVAMKAPHSIPTPTNPPRLASPETKGRERVINSINDPNGSHFKMASR